MDIPFPENESAVTELVIRCKVYFYYLFLLWQYLRLKSTQKYYEYYRIKTILSRFY